MPLYEVGSDNEFTPLKQLRGGADLYEQRIEDLFWSDPEAFTGEVLFSVKRQPAISSGGRPDAVLLDKTGRVVVVEIKRDIQRQQLSQCLEYAGWASTA